MNHGPHQWRKSSYSSASTSCVELASDLTRLRDSKNPTGPALSGNMATLVAEIRSGRLAH